MGRLLNLPTVKRYMADGCNGTTKDTLIELDKLIEGHEHYIRGVEFRVNNNKLDADLGFEYISRVSGIVNDLWDKAMSLIPTNYFPFAVLINDPILW